MATQGVISQELLDPTAVVSIDYGTAYCGIGYAMTASGGSKISIGAPGENIAGKTPTALFLDEHNNLLAFGREAAQAYMTYLEEKNNISGENGNANTATPTATKTCALYQGFKMALYNMKPGTDLIITAEDGVHTIPALKLLAMSLCALKEYAISFILKQTTRALKVDEIAWVITVPAIWEEHTKLFMRQAATEAGIVQYSMSARLKIALEPEAAAIAVESQLNGVLQQGSKFLVVDCGAGTIDVTAYAVTKTNPIQLNELIGATGGPWGGMCVDRNFDAWLQEFIGPALYVTLHQSFPSERYHIRQNFLKLKESVATSHVLDLDALYNCDVDINLRELCMQYNNRHDKCAGAKGVSARGQTRVELSQGVMATFYDKTVDNIVKHVEMLLAQPELLNVEYLLLAGGFGCSSILQQTLKTKLTRIKLAIPPRPREAVMVGAVMLGLKTHMTIKERVSVCAYGLRSTTTVVDKYPRHLHMFDATLGRTVVADVFTTVVEKGQKLATGHKVRVNYSPLHTGQSSIEFQVYTCRASRPPQLVTDRTAMKLGSFSIACDPNASREHNECSVEFCFGLGQLEVSAVNLYIGQQAQVELAMPK